MIQNSGWRNSVHNLCLPLKRGTLLPESEDRLTQVSILEIYFLIHSAFTKSRPDPDTVPRTGSVMNARISHNKKNSHFRVTGQKYFCTSTSDSSISVLRGLSLRLVAFEPRQLEQCQTNTKYCQGNMSAGTFSFFRFWIFPIKCHTATFT